MGGGRRCALLFRVRVFLLLPLVQLPMAHTCITRNNTPHSAHDFRADKEDPARVWFTTRTTGTHKGRLVLFDEEIVPTGIKVRTNGRIDRKMAACPYRAYRAYRAYRHACVCVCVSVEM